MGQKNIKWIAFGLSVLLLSFLLPALATEKEKLQTLQGEIKQLKTEEKKTHQHISKTEKTLKNQSLHINRLYQDSRTFAQKVNRASKKLQTLEKEATKNRTQLKETQGIFSQTVVSSIILLEQKKEFLFFGRKKLTAKYLYKKFLQKQTETMQNLIVQSEKYEENKKALQAQKVLMKKTILKAEVNLKALVHARKKQESAFKKLSLRLKSVQEKRLQKEKEAKALKELLLRLKEPRTSYELKGLSFLKAKGKLEPPLKGSVLRRFGYREARDLPALKGIVIKTKRGSLVHSVYQGVVAYADYLSGFGYLVVLKHAGGYLTLYGYNDSVLVRKGQFVRAGAYLAYSGIHPDFGASSYFGIRYHQKDINPKVYLRKQGLK